VSASDYFLAALRLAAHLAFIISDSFFLPAGVKPPFFFADVGADTFFEGVALPLALVHLAL